MEDKTILTDEHVEGMLAECEGWRREGNYLKKDFIFANFAEINDFLPYMAGAIVGLNHHPDFEFDSGEKRVSVSVTTHSEGRITQVDFSLALALNAWRGA